MSNEKFEDLTSILNHGRGSQNRLADLNRLVSERIKNADYSNIHRLFEELLSIAGETDIKKMAKKEEQLDELCGDLANMRIRLLKEYHLLRALHDTNDSYLLVLEQEITEASEYLRAPISASQKDIYTRTDTLQKRIQELSVTQSVGVSFSEQIRLTEANLLSLSDRIWNVLVNLVPLLRGRISLETSQLMKGEILKLMPEKAPG